MRWFACLLLVVGCQHQDSAERSAQVTAAQPAVAQVAPAPAPEKLAEAPAMHSCGGACGGNCGGTMATCGGGESCGGNTPGPSWAALPANATWTDLHVAGMHCGGCAKRIERALAGVDGVLGVKVDLKTAKVAVATKAGVDARSLTKSTIDGLGYQVQ